MNKNKLNYLSPETETLVVRFEGNLLTGTTQASVAADMSRGGGYGATDSDYFDLD